MVYPKANLPAVAAPWGRYIEKDVINLQTVVATERVNNAARDAQLLSSQKRLDSSVKTVAAAATAAQAALDATDIVSGEVATLVTDVETLSGQVEEAVTEVSTLESNIYFPGTTTINGGNIRTGTIGTNQISASYVYAGSIQASQITAGTLTGFTINTAASGTRVEVSGTTIRFYDSSDLVGTMLSNSSDTLAIVTPMGGGVTFLPNGGTVISGFMLVGGASFTSITNQGSYTSTGSVTVDGALTRTAMAGSATRYAYVTSGGAIIAGASLPSDSRLKEKVSTTELGLNFINSINPVEFEFTDKRNPHNQGTQFGVIAQELVEALSDNGVDGPNGIVYIPQTAEADGGSDGYYLVNHEQLISPIIKAIQELGEKVNKLEGK